MNHVIGVKGRKLNRTFHIDGKCVDCGNIISKNYKCFIITDVENLQEVLNVDFLCDKCGLKHFKEDFCEDCDSICNEDETRECYLAWNLDGYQCACPI